MGFSFAGAYSQDCLEIGDLVHRARQLTSQAVERIEIDV